MMNHDELILVTICIILITILSIVSSISIILLKQDVKIIDREKLVIIESDCKILNITNNMGVENNVVLEQEKDNGFKSQTNQSSIN